MSEAYGVTSETGTYDNLFAGQHPPVEIPVTVKSGSGSLSRGAPLGQRLSDLKYEPITPGLTYEDEDLGDGDGSTKLFSGTLAQPGVKPGSLVIAAIVVGDGVETFTDNGDGTLTSDGATPGSGTIDYATGAYSVTFFVAPKSGEDVLATYIGDLSAAAAESIGTGTAGGQTEWSGYLANTKVIERSVYIYTNDTTPKELHDDGNGNLVGDDGHGTINYETGEYEIVFDTAPAEDKTIKVDYCHTDGSDVLRAILVRDVDATSADVKATAYVHGEFRRSAIGWPTGVSEAQKDEIVRASMDRGIFIKADQA
jgi:hypothetical protein